MLPIICLRLSGIGAMDTDQISCYSFPGFIFATNLPNYGKKTTTTKENKAQKKERKENEKLINDHFQDEIYEWWRFL